MKLRSLIFAALFTAVALASCDEGDIREQTTEVVTSGKVALLNVRISGLGSWSPQYNVVLAAFAQDSEYAAVQKPLPEGAEGDVQTTLKITGADVSTIELCVTNRLRQRVVTFASVAVDPLQGDTIRLDAASVDAGMYRTIQHQVFTPTCARCHGLGNAPAAGLTLAEGQSYAALVNRESAKPGRGLRVVPGNATESLLHKVIHGDPGSGVGFDHSNMIKDSKTTTLIDHWINAGAKP